VAARSSQRRKLRMRCARGNRIAASVPAFSSALNLRCQFYYVTSSPYGMLVRVTLDA